MQFSEQCTMRPFRSAYLSLNRLWDVGGQNFTLLKFKENISQIMRSKTANCCVKTVIAIKIEIWGQI